MRKIIDKYANSADVSKVNYKQYEKQGGNMKKYLEIKNNWYAAADPSGIGHDENWWEAIPESVVPAIVPGGTKLFLPEYSGKELWYYNKFTADISRENGERYILRIGRALYYAEVWLNGEYLGGHTGGTRNFDFDVTDTFKTGQENMICICVNTSQNLCQDNA